MAVSALTAARKQWRRYPRHMKHFISVVVSARWLVRALPILALLGFMGFQFFQMQKLDRNMRHLQRQLHYFQNLDSRIDQPPEPTQNAPIAANVNIISPADNAMVRKAPVSIIGEAPDRFVLVLMKNDRPVQATVPQEQVFRFELASPDWGQNEWLIKAIDPEGGIQLMDTVRFYYMDPGLAERMRDFHRGVRDQKRLALTFDGGAMNNAAGPILDILRQFGIRSTFFLTGRFIRNYPDLTRRIVAEGHEVGNHTWDHPHLTTFAQNRRHDLLPGMTRERFQEQLRRTAKLFQQVTGQEMAPFWRAPYGEQNAVLRRWAAELGYRHIGWTNGSNLKESMDTMDWVSDPTSSAYQSSVEILQHLLAIADRDSGWGAAGGVILMHLGSQRKEDPVFVILPDFITAMRARGYEFVTISDLVRPPRS